MGFRALDRATGSRTLRPSAKPGSRTRDGRRALQYPPRARRFHGGGRVRLPAMSEKAKIGGPGSGKTLVLGVLGGIASGKSAAARLLAGPDGVVISADELAREALDSPAVLARVRERFGDQAVGPDGRADRGFIARIVFDPERGRAARSELEGWTHPLVRARIAERLSAARAAGVPRVVLDVPLLLEN